MKLLNLIALLSVSVSAYAQTQPETAWLIYQNLEKSPSIQIWKIPAVNNPGKATEQKAEKKKSANLVWRLIAGDRITMLAEMQQPPLPKGYVLNFGQCEVDGIYRHDVIAIVKHSAGKEWSSSITQSWLADPQAKAFTPFKPHEMRCQNEGFGI